MTYFGDPEQDYRRRTGTPTGNGFPLPGSSQFRPQPVVADGMLGRGEPDDVVKALAFTQCAQLAAAVMARKVGIVQRSIEDSGHDFLNGDGGFGSVGVLVPNGGEPLLVIGQYEQGIATGAVGFKDAGDWDGFRLAMKELIGKSWQEVTTPGIKTTIYHNG